MKDCSILSPGAGKEEGGRNVLTSQKNTVWLFILHTYIGELSGRVPSAPPPIPHPILDIYATLLYNIPNIKTLQ